MSSKISTPRKIWRVVITLSSVISALYIPARLVMPLTGSHYLFLDVLITGIFFIDFILNNFIDKKEITAGENRISGRVWFVIDLLAIIPFGFRGDAFYLFRLLKLARVSQYMHDLRMHWIKYSDYLSFSFFLLWFAVISHWLACEWLSQTEPVNPDSIYENYITALYWVIQTLTTVGYGDVPPVTTGQKIYTIFVMLIGVGVYGYIIGNVASMLSQQDPAKAYYIKNIERLKAFVKYRKLPEDLQHKIKEYYAYIWKRKLGFDESSFLATLPPALKTETALFLKKEILDQIPIFQNASDEFKREVALNFRSMVYSPGDIICSEGEIGKEMYFIIQGELEVISGDGSKKYALLRDGNFFGEISLFENSPRTASVRAVTYSDLYILEKKVVEQILAKFPAVSEQIKSVSQERYGLYK